MPRETTHEAQSLRIDRLGAQGDGVADVGDGVVHVPFALPGETVLASGAGHRRKLERVVKASPDRIDPVCRHFGQCGGCQLQHLSGAGYRQWKRELVAAALARDGIETELLPMHSYPVAARRRAIFTALRTDKGILFGFSQRDTNRVVDLEVCPVLAPELANRISDFRRLCALLAPRKGTMKLAVILTEGGLDIAALNGGFTPEKARQQAIEWAGSAKIARLSLNGETLIEFTRPWLAAGIARVIAPADGFVQALRQAEADMGGLVTGHLGNCAHVADLFSGHGAFALRLAEVSRVTAVDSSASALAALDQAWRDSGGRLKSVTTLRRDLFKSPLMANELKRFDGAVFDPPRAGAEAQSRELALSGVKRIAAVSCNPATLARDLRILADGGYRILSVTPFDQFVFTPHVEAVALLER